MTTAETTQLIQSALIEFYGPGRGREILDAIAERYRTAGMPLDVFVNLTLREAWRLEHGDTSRWDSNARTTGFKADLYERNRPILKPVAQGTTA